MGLMQKFRRRMPVVIIFLIIMFVALIVFEWGDARRGRGAVRSGDASAGEINGEQISLGLYQKRVQDIIDMQRQQNPDAEVDDDRIREGVWQQLVDEILIRQTADRLGIVVTDDELREALLYDPPPALKQPFTDSTGVFHQKEFFQFMTNTRAFLTERKLPPEEIQKVENQILSIQDGLRSERLREAVQAVVTASALPSPAEARASFDEQRAKASGNFAMLDVNSISDAAVNVAEDEAKKYYDEHKTDYQQKASREIRYAMFTLAPSAQDSGSMNKRLKTVSDALARAASPSAKDTVFESFVNQYGSGKYPGTAYTPLQELSPELQNALQGAQPGTVIGPIRLADGGYLINVVDVKDSGDTYVKASHILLRTGTSNDDSVKALADKVYQRAKGGESFESLAQQYSADGSAQRGGDLGYFKKGAMVKPFEDAALSASVGSIVGPVKTEFGWHIIKVTDRTSRGYKLRDLRFDPKVSNMTKTALRAKAQQFRDKVAAGGTPIDTLGAQMKVQVLESGPLDRVTPAAGSTKLTAFAYDGKVGDVSEVIELKDGSLVVGQISKIRANGTMDFADAKETIIAKLKTKKKLDMLKDRATKIRAALGAGDSLTKLTTIDSSVQIRAFNDATRSTPFPGVGFDYVLTNAVFNQKLGQVSDLIRGERGYYIVQVSNRTVPTDKEYEVERPKFVQQLTEQRRQTMFQEWLQKEREHADIQDFRSGAQ
jgi:peptidyl-prolyl cis-trans isomerase D